MAKPPSLNIQAPVQTPPDPVLQNAKQYTQTVSPASELPPPFPPYHKTPIAEDYPLSEEDRATAEKLKQVRNSPGQYIQQKTPSKSAPGLDTRYHKEVAKLQAHIANVLSAFQINGLIGTLEQNDKLQFLMNKLIEGSKTKISFLDRIKALTTGANKAPDGQWGNLTSNAMTSVILLASAMVQFSAQLKQPLKSISAEQCKEMAMVVKDTKMPTEQKAKELIPLVDMVKDAVAGFATSIKENIQHLTDDTKLAVKDKAQEISDKEKQFVKEKADMVIPGIKFDDKFPIKYFDISDMAHFQAYLKDKVKDGEMSGQVVANAIKQLKDQLKAPNLDA